MAQTNPAPTLPAPRRLLPLAHFLFTTPGFTRFCCILSTPPLFVFARCCLRLAFSFFRACYHCGGLCGIFAVLFSHHFLFAFTFVLWFYLPAFPLVGGGQHVFYLSSFVHLRSAAHFSPRVHLWCLPHTVLLMLCTYMPACPFCTLVLLHAALPTLLYTFSRSFGLVSLFHTFSLFHTHTVHCSSA